MPSDTDHRPAIRGSFYNHARDYPPIRRVVRAVPMVVDGQNHALHVLECGHWVTKRVLVRPMKACPCTQCAQAHAKG